MEQYLIEQAYEYSHYKSYYFYTLLTVGLDSKGIHDILVSRKSKLMGGKKKKRKQKKTTVSE
jgi:hypothetical protein